MIFSLGFGVARHLLQRRSLTLCDSEDGEAGPGDLHFLIPALLRPVISPSILRTKI
jgi:hypothetical protein